MWRRARGLSTAGDAPAFAHGPARAGPPENRFAARAPAWYPARGKGGPGWAGGEEGRAMAVERTLSIIKPDATRRNLTGAINAKFEAAGLRIVAQKRILMTRAQAEAFYAVHRERSFFAELTEFMSSGPVVVQVLEGEDAIAKNREVMGATNPAEAALRTVRKDFALSIGENSVHGSDAPETAAAEIPFFFAGLEIVG